MMRVAMKMLLHDRAKYLALVIGIAFSALLISQQSGIFLSAMQLPARPIRELSAADVWVVNKGVEALDESEPMQEGRLPRVRSIEGVAWAMPFFQTTLKLKTEQGRSKTVVVVAVDDLTLVGAPSTKMVAGDVKDLHKPGGIVMDIPGYTTIFPGRELRMGRTFEMGRKRVEIVGFCRVEPDWSGLPVVYATRSCVAEMLGDASPMMNAIVVRTQEGDSPEEVARRIAERTGLSAYTSSEFESSTILWTLETSGLAENFGITIALGVIIGVVIVGQTFYMFSVENLKQFAALKAIGIGNGQILRMIVLQALSVGSLGYCLGIGVASLFFAAVNPTTGGLRGMFMAPWIFVGTGVFIILITLLSCLVSVRRVLVVDPAIVFRG